MTGRPQKSPLFPYTPLFRSLVGGGARHMHVVGRALGDEERVVEEAQAVVGVGAHGGPPSGRRIPSAPAPCCKRRSEEHTSELQSPCNLVCRLLLEKKKTIYV